MDQNIRRLLLIASLIAYIMGLGFISLYLMQNQLPHLLFAVLSVLVANSLVACLRLKYRLIHLLFYAMIFIFLLSRPTIQVLRDGYLISYQAEVYQFAFSIVLVMIVAIALGDLLGEWWTGIQRVSLPLRAPDSFTLTMRTLSLGGFLATYPFYVLRLVERWIYRRQTSYYEYYASFQSRLPYFTYILSAFMFYFLCLYLATKPKKWQATLLLMANIVANAIHLLIGTRNPAILAILFAFVYYFIRNQQEPGQWIGRLEKGIMVVGTPILVLAMGALNYLRDQVSVAGFNAWTLFVDFLFKQGTSFGVLANGYIYQTALPIRPLRNYTFGSILDYFYRGSLGNRLFGTIPIQNTTNSYELALETNSYAHSLSHLVLKEDYIAGHGVGSSFIMEIYTDYGWLGTFVFGLALGILFVYMMKKAYSSRGLGFAIQLLILGNLFFMPRSSFAESFFPLFTMQFWFIVLLVLLTSYLMRRRPSDYLKK